MASARRSRPPAKSVRRCEQVELFPEPVHVERLDPRRGGERTSAQAVYRVTLGHAGELHVVYHDRHGVYCEEHGRGCRAVKAVQG